MAADNPYTHLDAPPAPKLEFNGLQQQANDAWMQTKIAHPLATDSQALPSAFSSGGNDLSIVDRDLAASMKKAESMMTKEQLARVNAEAEIPMKYIKVAGEHGAETEIKAKAGDSYWGLAQQLIAQRHGGAAPGNEIMQLVKDMASYNGKTLTEAAHLHVGEIVKVPPPKTQH